ncbi:hypothetical protein GCM10010185_38330 [Saccharothrix coeruleofusca]|uniref:Uncharacterized protein n=2 Tax=Saccharothrix coeruleofusca TaxID=33919 RepID=A0A918EFM5_9PSEU|nr:hypothetical protein GCM10010185_38330 [Saccharothrix coeruleofusca]
MGRVGSLLLCGIVLSGLVAGTGRAADGAVTMNATVDGAPVGADVLVLAPGGSSRISVTVHNGTAATRYVKTIRLSGTALALPFFSYDTTIPFEVPAGRSVTRGFVLDLAQLGGQATGLLPARLQVLDANRDVIAAVSATADVRGSTWSVYGLFGLALAVLAALAWAAALLALARQRLPASRWRRALRFLPAGVGSGLAAVVLLSALRVVTPTPVAEAVLVLGCAAVALVLGALTPPPETVEAPLADPEATQRLRPVAGRGA